MKYVIVATVLTVSFLHASQPAAAAGGTLRAQRAALTATLPAASNAGAKAAGESAAAKPVVILTKAQLAPKPTTPAEESANFDIFGLKQIAVDLTEDEVEALAFKKDSSEATTLKSNMVKLLGLVAAKPLTATMKDDGTPTFELNVQRRAQLGYSTNQVHTFARGERVLVPNGEKEYVYGVVLAQKDQYYMVQTNFDAPSLLLPAAIGKKAQK